MATKSELDFLISYIKSQQSKIDFNNKMFEIMEGNLLKYVEAELKNQLNDKSASLALKRVAPINIWNKIVKKLSRIYASPVLRTTENPSDQELINYYVEHGLDDAMGDMNENYNAYKWSSIEIFEDEEIKELSFRAIPSNQFLVFSTDIVNPLRMTGLLKFMGTHKTADGRVKNKYWVYTKDSFTSFYDDGTIVTEDMQANKGINPFGVIPFEYLSMSKYLLVPNPDRDTLEMTTLIPVLITDQNFSSFYASHPIVAVIDGDAAKLPVNPNVFWNLKSDNEERAASIDVVKAEPNLKAQMDHVISQLNMWLDSRDIRAGSVGSVNNGEQFASGISKIVSEMDTLENRKDQERRFRMMEKRFWKKLAIMHNTLAPTGRLSN